MPKITGRQIWITLITVLLASPAFLPSGSAAFRPAWFTDRVLGIPLSAWTMLGLIIGYLILLRVISSAVFDESDGNEGASS